jgi:hypothetical protein
MSGVVVCPEDKAISFDTVHSTSYLYVEETGLIIKYNAMNKQYD